MLHQFAPTEQTAPEPSFPNTRTFLIQPQTSNAAILPPVTELLQAESLGQTQTYSQSMNSPYSAAPNVIIDVSPEVPRFLTSSAQPFIPLNHPNAWQPPGFFPINLTPSPLSNTFNETMANPDNLPANSVTQSFSKSPSVSPLDLSIGNIPQRFARLEHSSSFSARQIYLGVSSLCALPHTIANLEYICQAFESALTNNIEEFLQYFKDVPARTVFEVLASAAKKTQNEYCNYILGIFSFLGIGTHINFAQGILYLQKASHKLNSDLGKHTQSNGSFLLRLKQIVNNSEKSQLWIELAYHLLKAPNRSLERIDIACRIILQAMDLPDFHPIELGKAVELTANEAFQLFSALQKEHPLARFILGILFLLGIGHPLDLAQAFQNINEAHHLDPGNKRILQYLSYCQALGTENRTPEMINAWLSEALSSPQFDSGLVKCLLAMKSYAQEREKILANRNEPHFTQSLALSNQNEEQRRTLLARFNNPCDILTDYLQGNPSTLTSDHPAMQAPSVPVRNGAAINGLVNFEETPSFHNDPNRSLFFSELLPLKNGQHEANNLNVSLPGTATTITTTTTTTTSSSSEQRKANATSSPQSGKKRKEKSATSSPQLGKKHKEKSATPSPQLGKKHREKSATSSPQSKKHKEKSATSSPQTQAKSPASPLLCSTCLPKQTAANHALHAAPPDPKVLRERITQLEEELAIKNLELAMKTEQNQQLQRTVAELQVKLAARGPSTMSAPVSSPWETPTYQVEPASSPRGRRQRRKQ